MATAVMAAKGGFSFRDESVNVQFRADAKKFSVFSGQSPVNIGGTARSIAACTQS